MTTTSEKAPVAVVTGAARGLGQALVQELCRRNVRVAGVGRSAASLAPLAQSVSGHNFLPVVADVAQPDMMHQAFLDVDAHLGSVDILINNAAVYPHRDILDETPSTFMDTLGVNVAGPMIATHEALKRMVPNGQGRIITVTSFAGRRPAPMSAAYSVSKEAARAYSRALFADLSDRFPGIVITDWIPGALQTEMGIPEGHTPERAAKWGAALALLQDRALNGEVFVENRQELLAKSFKRRLFDKLVGRKETPVILPE